MTSAIITITGPSCVGKSHLESALCKDANFSKVVSHTTRPQRSGEVDGKDYFFVSQAEFERLKDDGAFVEYVSFGGAHYAASRQQFEDILAADKFAVIVAEPTGRDEILAYADDSGIAVLPVFLSNPTSVLADRFVQRMLGDFVLALARPAAEKVVTTYTKRLDAMLGEERDWMTAVHPNSFTIGRFDATNETAVVTKIVSMAYKIEPVNAVFEIV